MEALDTLKIEFYQISQYSSAERGLSLTHIGQEQSWQPMMGKLKLCEIEFTEVRGQDVSDYWWKPAAKMIEDTRAKILGWVLEANED